jgi:hypothetical protein
MTRPRSWAVTARQTARYANLLISERHSNAPEKCIDITNNRPSASKFWTLVAASFMNGGVMPRGPRGEKRPADVIGNAVKVMRIATGEEIEKIDSAKSAAAELGRLGGKARAARMTPERRSEIAKSAAKARWRNKPQ